MTRITARNGQRVERLSRLPSPPRIHRRGAAKPPSERYGARWAALPVEGSKAWRAQRAGIFARLLGGAK